MKKINIHYFYLFFIGAMLFMASCEDDGSQAEKEEDVKDTASVAETSRTETENNEELSYTLPSPIQIAAIFKKAGLKYYSGLTNPIENSGNYSSANTVARTLGFGVYVADLSYCVINKQNQESKNYFKTCKQLSESIGITSAFQNNNVPVRLEKNMNNTDSIFKILAEMQMEADNALEENKQGYISVISFTGAWIESMYIGEKVYAKEKNTNVAINLIEQMGIAENIIKALKANRDNGTDITRLLQDMNSLNEVYNNFKSVKEMKEADPDVMDPTKLSIGEDELQSFSNKVEEIRTRIIKG